jgi:hypothetical protein
MKAPVLAFERDRGPQFAERLPSLPEAKLCVRLARKGARLAELAPRAAATVEKILDDLLEELEGTQPNNEIGSKSKGGAR